MHYTRKEQLGKATEAGQHFRLVQTLPIHVPDRQNDNVRDPEDVYIRIGTLLLLWFVVGDELRAAKLK